MLFVKRYLIPRLIAYVLVIWLGITVVFFIPRLTPNDPVMRMIGEMRGRGSTLEPGTMDDIIEEVVGEIEVGYDFDEYHPKPRIYIEHESENSHLMSGRTPISEVNDILYVKFPVEEAHTIGGLITSRLRHIPREGDSIVEQGHRISVLEADERSVIKVRVERL